MTAKPVLALVLAVGLVPGLARAETVLVLGYLRAEVQVYSAAGVPDPKPTPVSRLPKPPYTSTQSGPAKTVGFPLDGRTVFVRRLDLRLGPAPCITVAGGAAKPGGTVQAGERMGAGDSADCLLQ